jgi:lipopolysaccharide exporter
VLRPNLLSPASQRTTSLARVFVGSAFARDTGVLMLGTAAAQALNFVGSPLLTRLYQPEQLGTLALVLSLYSILTPLASWRYEQAIMLPPRDDAAAPVLGLALVTTLSMLVLSIVLTATVGPMLAVASGRAGLVEWLWVVPTVLLLAGLYQALRTWLGRGRAFGSIALGRLARAGAGTGAQLIAGLVLGASALGLVGGYLMGTGLEVMVLLSAAWRRPRTGNASQVRLADVRRLAVRYRKFPLFAVPGALSNMLSLELPTLLLATFFAPAEVGLYWLSYRVLALPTALVGEATGTVFYQRMTAMRAKGESGAALTTQTFAFLLAVALVPMGLLYAVAPVLFGFAFGPAWVQAGEYARALIPAEIMLFVALPLTQAFFIYEKQEIGLVWNLGFLAVSAGGFALGAALGSPLVAVQCYSIGCALMYGLVVALAFMWSGGRVRNIPAYITQAVAASLSKSGNMSHGLAKTAYVGEAEIG